MENKKVQLSLFGSKVVCEVCEGNSKMWPFSSTSQWCCLLHCTTNKVVLTFVNVLWMKSYSMTIQMKATEQYFPVVLFIMLYKVVLTFETVDEILKFDHSNESY